MRHPGSGDSQVQSEPRGTAAGGMVRSGIWTVALSIVAASIAAVLGVLALVAYLYRDQVEAEARSQSVAIARVLEEHANKILSIHAATLSHIEWMVDDLGWQRIAESPLLHRRLVEMADRLPEVQSYWIVDDAGMLRATSYEWPPRTLNVSDRDYFTAHSSGRRGIHIGDRLSGRINNEIFFTVSQRMESPDGSFQGVAQVSLLPSYFGEFYRSVLRNPNDVIILLRDDGMVISREPFVDNADKADIGRLPELIGAAESDGVFRTVTPFDGVERLMARRKVPGLPVHVVYGVATADLSAEWKARIAPYIYFAVPVTLLLAAVGAVASRRSREVTEAQAALRRVNDALEHRIAERTRHLDQALADKEVLLRDVHHRVKNNLQVIWSLLQLQAQRSPDLRPQFDEALSRINTMGLIHEQIYRSTGVSEVRLDEFIGALCQNLRSFHESPERTVTITYAADPVSLDLHRAVPFSLILNEVISNAFKHAFPKGRDGRIEISVTDQEDSIRLSVCDNGCGKADQASSSRSMGMDLIRAFSRQLRGEYRFVNEDGLRFDLTFPKQSDGT